jgi:cyclic-di-GMP phosphodiesterase, flagellum assembly factor TipF
MPRLSHGVVMIFASVAGLVAAAFIYRAFGVPLSTSLVAGTLVVLAVAHLHSLRRQALERADAQDLIDHLSAVQDHLRGEHDMIRQRMAILADDVETKVSARNDRLVSEVKVLEVLIRRLAEGIATQAKSFPAGDDAAETRASARAIRPGEMDPGGADDSLMLEIVRRSLDENRIDLYLQPVVSLPQRKVRYYEAFSRLRADDGQTIMPSQYIRVAEPAGLMSVVDNVLLFRCVQVVRRLTIRQKDVAVFCNLSRYTLQDTGFFAQFLDFMQHNRDLAQSIVFEIAQDALDHCGPVEEANLNYLADLGFSFSVDKVTSLDLDFAWLRERRVRYVKVSGQILLADLSRAGAPVAAPDLKELMARYGITLIAEKIESEREVVNLLDFNIDTAQGFLFGEPRPLRETMLEKAHAPAMRKSAEWPKPSPDPLPPVAQRERPAQFAPEPAPAKSDGAWPKRQAASPTPLSALAVKTMPRGRDAPVFRTG